MSYANARNYVIPPLYIGDRSGFQSPETEFEGEDGEIFFDPNDDRTPVLDTSPIPYRFVCHLRITLMATGSLVKNNIGTGILIGDKYVLTSAHNLKIVEGGVLYTARDVTVSPGRITTASSSLKWSPFGASKAKSFFTPNGFDGTAATAYLDYGLILLREAAGKKTFKSLGNQPFGYWGSASNGGPTRIASVTADSLVGKTIRVCGYPRDKCGADSLAANPNCLEYKRQGTQFQSAGQVIGVKTNSAGLKMIAHRADTTIGQSGGPIWVEEAGRLNLVAVHSIETPGDNFGVPFTAAVRADLVKWGWSG